MSGKDLTEALRALTEGQQGSDAAGPAAMKTRGAAGVERGSALLGGPESGSASGIASPLVETAYSDRTFHTTINVASTDGLFTLKIKPVKKIKFKDAAGRDVLIEYKAPT